MIRSQGGRLVVAALAGMVLVPTMASAQQSAAGIAGLVRDTSGAALPGVTVEATSPALIERVRTVYTGGEGRYNVVDLRPGTFTVTFTLPGFATFRREGIELTSGFTATVNAELSVGGIAESVTVSAVAPAVDVQNVREVLVIPRQDLDGLPLGNLGLSTLGALAPHVYTPRTELAVGGAASELNPPMGDIRGSRAQDRVYLQDGMNINNMQSGASNRNWTPNAAMVQEVVFETGAISTEASAGGILVNYVPKEGANSFGFNVAGGWGNHALTANNLTDELKSRGLRRVNFTNEIWDFHVAAGGPIKRDKLWFFAADRRWGFSKGIVDSFFNKTQGTPFFTPDFSRPALNNEHIRSSGVRLTWQAAEKHKVNLTFEDQTFCGCRRFLVDGSIAPEASMEVRMGGKLAGPMRVYQASWSSPITSRLLLDAGLTVHPIGFNRGLNPEATDEDVAIVELSNNFRYNNQPNFHGPSPEHQQNSRFSVSYVTGSHYFKTGLTTHQGWLKQTEKRGGNTTYQLLNGQPQSIIVWATPLPRHERLDMNLGLYAQDRWTINRVTLNYGARFDYVRGSVPAQHLPVSQYRLVARDFAAIPNLPNFKDVSPRVGVAWDVFGTGTTAIKGHVGKYLTNVANEIARLNNPLNTIVTSAVRTWHDANGDFIPQEEELGPLSNAAFGQSVIRTRFAPETLEGFGNRQYQWSAALEVQQTLLGGVSMNAGYYRRQYGNLLVNDNLEVTPADYDPYSITAPVDSRLPGGGGDVISGLYNVTPAKFGKVNELVTHASHFGKMTEVSDYFDIGIIARLRGAQLGGGLSTGRQVRDKCFVVDSPQLRHCRVVFPFAALTQVKLHGTYPLPWDLSLSGVYQDLAGPPIQASYVASNAEIAPSLGRNLAAGARAREIIDLMEPNTRLEARGRPLDLRLTKRLRVRNVIASVALDAYNVFNASPIFTVNTRYGPEWLKPLQVLEGRFLKLSFQLNY